MLFLGILIGLFIGIASMIALLLVAGEQEEGEEWTWRLPM